MVRTDNIMDDFIKELMEQAMNEGKVIRLSVKGGDWSAALGEDIEALSRVELEGITLGWRTGWAERMGVTAEGNRMEGPV